MSNQIRERSLAGYVGRVTLEAQPPGIELVDA
jgi:hypothetical protein